MTVFSPFQKKESLQFRVNFEDTDAISKFAAAFTEKLLLQKLPPDKPRVLVCIGTDRSTGDSLGPLVGSKLKEMDHQYFDVFGTLSKPVHASNLAEHLNVIENIGDPFVIAIDACLGNAENVGFINLGEGALKPGAGVNKSLPQVGNLHITGVVNVGGFMEYFVLQNTRLNLVMEMAKIISEGIHLGSMVYSTYHHPLLKKENVMKQ